MIQKPYDTDVKFVKMSQRDAFVQKNHYKIIQTDEQYDSEYSAVKMKKGVLRQKNLVVCGIQVLSMSKRIMNEAMCLCEDNNLPMYGVDTDGYQMINEDLPLLQKLFQDKYNREFIGNYLGHFSCDYEIEWEENGRKMEALDCKASRAIFLGKKCYLSQVVGRHPVTNEQVKNWHVRLKGVPNSTIFYETNRRINSGEIEDIYGLYNILYEKTPGVDIDGSSGKVFTGINFDLTEGGNRVRFKFQDNNCIVYLKEFQRNLNFRKPPKGIEIVNKNGCIFVKRAGVVIAKKKEEFYDVKPQVISTPTRESTRTMMWPSNLIGDDETKEDEEETPEIPTRLMSRDNLTPSQPVNEVRESKRRRLEMPTIEYARQVVAGERTYEANEEPAESQPGAQLPAST